MRAPIDWLKEYIELSLPIKELAWKLTEIGLAVEKIDEKNGSFILELEITPNRPDLLSITGIAREIAALEEKPVKLPQVQLPAKEIDLPINVNNDFSLFKRYSAVIIDGVQIRQSPEWLQQRLVQMNLRPINNIVDVTNYVMYESGLPLHAFDYKQILGHEINVLKAKGGEDFTTVDQLSYKLPEGAMIIKDKNRLIDLAGIKGGLNSGIQNYTETVYLHSTVNNPLLIRKASRILGLKSDASYIYERGVDPAGTLPAVKRAASLILQTSGGKIASELIDLKNKDYQPRKLSLRFSRFEKITGIRLPEAKIVSILKNLNFDPEVTGKDELISHIPTYRKDIEFEEDLIEEVARIYGYNSFPRTLPVNPPPQKSVAYQISYDAENRLKNVLIGSGLTEIYSYSLIKNSDLDWMNINKNQVIRLENPVSLEFVFLRPSLLAGLIKAVKLNQANYESSAFFELGRVYRKNGSYGETNFLSLLKSGGSYVGIKGIIELFLDRLNIKDIKFSVLPGTYGNFPRIFDSSQSALISVKNKPLGIVGKIKNDKLDLLAVIPPVYAAEISWDLAKEYVSTAKYRPVSVYPPYKEDLSLILPKTTLAGDIITEISASSLLVKDVGHLDSYQNTLTLRIIYQAEDRNLTSSEISDLRKSILDRLLEKYGASLKKTSVRME